MKSEIKNISKKKTKKEQVIEIYIEGERNPQSIAKRVGCTVNAVNIYLSRARTEGKIEKEKTKKQKILEIYNKGEKDPQSIAKIIGTTVETVNIYLREEKRIEGIESKKNKEQIIEIYNGGEQNPQLIAEKLGVTVRTVNKYLRKARKEGKIESKPKAKTKKEKVLDIYYEGERNPQLIAERVGTTAERVNIYLREGRKEGKIESKPKVKTKKEQIIEIYIEGERNPQSIAKKVGCKINTVNTYLSEARRVGKIVKEKTKKVQVIEIYNEGERNPQSIAERVGCTVNAVNIYLSRARKEGKLEKEESIKEIIIEEPEKEEPEREKSDIQKSDNPISQKLKNKVMVLLETKYPREIAEELTVPSRIVYDIIDSLGKEYIKNLKVRKVKRNPLYPQIASLRKEKNISMEKALYVMAKTDLKLKDRIELARIYYILGNEKIPERLLNEILSYEKASSVIIRNAREERDNILLEIKSRKIREDYKNGKNMDGTNITYDDLCKKYNVRIGFLIDLIGHEEIERSM